MVKTVSVFPYIAVRLIGYEDLVHALNVEARYSPKDEEGTYWDIRDIQQVCLQYKGIWKSEVEDWKKGCEAFTEVDWAKVALKGWITDDRPSYTDSESEAGAAQASTSAASARRIVTRSVAAGIATAADLTTAATAVSNTTAEGPATTAIAATASSATPGPATITSIRTSLTPAQRFLEYRSRTKHRRGRLCPNCEMEFCNHSRHIEIEECDCGECDGDDADEDEFYKYYEEHQELEADDASASSQSSTSSESATTPNETVSSVMVPGHRARVVQCIYMEAF